MLAQTRANVKIKSHSNAKQNVTSHRRHSRESWNPGQVIRSAVPSPGPLRKGEDKQRGATLLTLLCFCFCFALTYLPVCCAEHRSTRWNSPRSRGEAWMPKPF